MAEDEKRFIEVYRKLTAEGKRQLIDFYSSFPSAQSHFSKHETCDTIDREMSKSFLMEGIK